MEKKRLAFALMAPMILVVAGCASPGVVQIDPPPANALLFNAPGPNPQVDTADSDGRVSGIWQGIWHGIISPVTLVMSFLNEDMTMYEVHNDGSQYDLGFLIGVAVVFGLLGLTAGRRR